jgi:uncharacterized protein
MAFNKELLEVLACPKCKGEIELKPDESGLICRACMLEYPIREYGIPCMIIEEAIPLQEKPKAEKP